MRKNDILKINDPIAAIHWTIEVVAHKAIRYPIFIRAYDDVRLVVSETSWRTKSEVNGQLR